MKDTHDATDDVPVLNRRSMLRRTALGTAGIAGLTALVGTGAASNCTKTDRYCDGHGREWIEVCCDDGTCHDVQIGMC
ncbi:hypothetical protein [Natronobiforma cellulositropha]|uniref:hypothetical protein n=1 Tax=Natronobiforma cellulositropha TaxID=1679076 RepID=UPI0021D5F66A|nr:hypothetical protein [Natronobiforma cellulositropha]